jgi:hypothetical protein
MFKIIKKPKYWVMKSEQGFIRLPSGVVKERYNQKVFGDEGIIGWTQIIDDVVAELEGRIGVKRTSYDTWQWTSNDELERFLTYFYLKYPIQLWHEILDPNEDIQ